MPRKLLNVEYVLEFYEIYYEFFSARATDPIAFGEWLEKLKETNPERHALLGSLGTLLKALAQTNADSEMYKDAIKMYEDALLALPDDSEELKNFLNAPIHISMFKEQLEAETQKKYPPIITLAEFIRFNEEKIGDAARSWYKLFVGGNNVYRNRSYLKALFRSLEEDTSKHVTKLQRHQMITVDLTLKEREFKKRIQDILDAKEPEVKKSPYQEIPHSKAETAAANDTIYMSGQTETDTIQSATSLRSGSKTRHEISPSFTNITQLVEATLSRFENLEGKTGKWTNIIIMNFISHMHTLKEELSSYLNDYKEAIFNAFDLAYDNKKGIPESDYNVLMQHLADSVKELINKEPKKAQNDLKRLLRQRLESAFNRVESPEELIKLYRVFDKINSLDEGNVKELSLVEDLLKDLSKKPKGTGFFGQDSEVQKAANYCLENLKLAGLSSSYRP